MRPGPRMPLNTREGVAQAPIEPGRGRCASRGQGPVEKLWRLTVPWKPLPFARPRLSLSGLERVGADLVADLELAGLAAELGQLPQRRRAGLAAGGRARAWRAASRGCRRTRAERPRSRRARRADARHRARAGLEHGDALHVAVLPEQLGHAELLREDRSHRARQVGSRCRRRRAGGRAAGASRPSWASAGGCR